jgi:hypothetical protein
VKQPPKIDWDLINKARVAVASPRALSVLSMRDMRALAHFSSIAIELLSDIERACIIAEEQGVSINSRGLSDWLSIHTPQLMIPEQEKKMQLEDFDRTEVEAPVTTVNGNRYMANARGELVPLESVKPVDMLMDELVRKMLAFAIDLNAQIARFKGHCFTDIGAFEALLKQEYNVERLGGARGNVSFTTFDGLMKVQVARADVISFGPQLQAAKALVDECLTDWSQGAGAELRAVVTRAFQVDKQGCINKAEIFMLLRTDIADARWNRAMDAVRDSIQVEGSKTYIRFYRRATPTEAWDHVTIDLANAKGERA